MTGKIEKFVATAASASLVCDTPLQAMVEGSVVVGRADLVAPATEIVEECRHEGTLQELVSSIIDAGGADEGRGSVPRKQISLGSIKPSLEFTYEARDFEGEAHQTSNPPYPCGQ